MNNNIFEELNNDISGVFSDNELREEMLLLIDKWYQIPDYNTPSRRKRLVDERFNYVANTIDEMKGSGTAALTGYSGPIVVRRKKVLLSYMEKAVEDFSQIRDLRSIEQTFVDFEMDPVRTYNSMDYEYDLCLAASIWILDDIRRSGKLHEIYQYLPTEYDDFDELPPDFYMVNYETDLLESVCALIRRRNGMNAFYDEVEASGKVKDTVERRNFDAVMDLLDKDRVEKACNRFRNHQWDLVGRQMCSQAYYDRRLKELISDLKQLVSPSVLSIGQPKLDPVELLDEYDQYMEQSRKNIIFFNEHLHTSRRELIKTLGRELADIYDGFEIEDPFEMCFAVLYLLSSGDDAPWLTRSGNAVLHVASHMLPWYLEEDASEEELDAWYDELCYDQDGWNKQEPDDDLDLYHTKFGELNLAQIIYRMCKGIAPRGLHPFRKRREQLIADGMDEDVAGKITELADILFLASFQARALNLRDDEYFPYFAEETTDEEEITVVEEEKDTERDLEKARAEIKNLRKALSELRRESKEERAKTEKELKQLRMEHRELADLRELVFNRENDVTEKIEEQITYPYETIKRTVIFGGHETFIKRIKEMLPTVKVVETGNYSFDSEIVRNADVVWIQTNCISHTQYGNIIRIVRQYGIQLRYFAYAGTEKCAEQLVIEDRRG